jgi:hypothetical protein
MNHLEYLLSGAFRRSQVMSLDIKQGVAGKVDLKLSNGESVTTTGVIGVALRVEPLDSNTTPATNRAGMPLITKSMAERGHILFMSKTDKKLHSLPLSRLIPTGDRVYIPLQFDDEIDTSKTEVMFTDNLGLSVTRAVELTFFYQ